MAACQTRVDARSANATAPPRQCEITRGAWCLLVGNYTVEAVETDEDVTIWEISRPTWHDETLRILEPATCLAASGIEPVVTEQSELYDHNGVAWLSVVVRVADNELCDLRLLIPAVDENDTEAHQASEDLGWLISTKIGICFPSISCTEIRVSNYYRNIFDF